MAGALSSTLSLYSPHTAMSASATPSTSAMTATIFCHFLSETSLISSTIAIAATRIIRLARSCTAAPMETPKSSRRTQENFFRFARYIHTPNIPSAVEIRSP